MKWDEVKVSGNEALADRTSAKNRSQELLVSLGVVHLKMELDRVPLWRSVATRTISTAEHEVVTGRRTGSPAVYLDI